MKYQIHNIRSSLVRNLMRGLLSVENRDSFEKTLQRIRIKSSPGDWNLVLQIIRASPLFGHSYSSRDFPTTFPEVLFPIDINDANFYNSLFATNESQLIILFRSFSETLALISQNKLSQIPDLIKRIRLSGGVSTILIRIAYFARQYMLANGTDQSLLDAEIEACRLGRCPVLRQTIRELLNQKTDYFSTRERIENATNEIQSDIIKTYISPIPSDAENFSRILGSHLVISLIDALVYSQYIHEVEVQGAFATLTLPQKLAHELDLFLSTKVNFDPLLISSSLSTESFRVTFLVQYLHCVRRYHIVHTSIYGRGVWRYLITNEKQKNHIKSYFSGLISLSDLLLEKEQRKANTIVFQPKSASAFEKSMALAYWLSIEKVESKIDESIFVKLMSRTQDIGHICNPTHLCILKSQAQSDDMRFVSTCLLHISSPTDLIEHELRNLLQDIVIRTYNANIIEFLEHISRLSPAVSNHLIQICDESFLLRLFRIITSPNTALHTRADMLDWYSKHGGDRIASESAKLLEIEVQMNKTKGTIDDHRIYVDPSRFTQWISDNILNEIFTRIDQMHDAGDTFPFSYDWNKKTSGTNSCDELALIIARTFKEFCVNSSFGIASILGRRIRHGTFIGTCLSVISKFSCNPDYQSLLNEEKASAIIQRWKSQYELSVNEFIENNLQVRSELKPNGLIIPFFESTQKKNIASTLTISIIKSYEDKRMGFEIPYIVLEMCWAMIEPDLSNIRKYIEYIKSHNGIFKPDISQLDQFRRSEMSQFSRTLNSEITSIFKNIASWFNRPAGSAGASPIKLFMNMIVDEVKDQVAGFHPNVIFPSSLAVISGKYYLIVYDAIYILISNAAKHGDPLADLTFDWGVTDSFASGSLSISITSVIKSAETLLTVKETIQSLLNSSCRDADSTEGKSGILKLCKMAEDGYIAGVSYEYEDNSITAKLIILGGYLNETIIS